MGFWMFLEIFIVKMISANDCRLPMPGCFFFWFCFMTPAWFSHFPPAAVPASQPGDTAILRFGKRLSSRNYRGLLQVFRCSASANLLYISLLSYIYKFGVVGIVSAAQSVFVFGFWVWVWFLLSVGNVFADPSDDDDLPACRTVNQVFPFRQTTKICL